ncbi:hypothetical protein Vadar_004923 [Vaccinium darrowii]|uniref:Uncharacterized protein n=1 Tax=Vaccinium darrowii TaxID=229202 RepID=A0ACB7WY94_9ERIC|nr:hypothetical protein Vadar_004923 [Vaccinium darrowii]
MMPIESGKHFWKHGTVGSSFTILVDNLPFEVGVPWFRKFFSYFGKIAEVFIPANRSNRTGNRYGYVRFAYQKDVAFAIANANGLWVGRRNLIVKRASYDRGMVCVGSNSLMMGIPQAEKQKDIDARRSLNLQPIATSWLQTSAVVKLRTLSTPDLVLKALHEFKMKEIQVKSLGGMYMIITFQNKDDRDQAMTNSIIRSWFSYFEPWNGDAASLSRLVWINCRGMPLNIWCHNSFKRIGEMWGEFIAQDVETIHGLSYEVGRLLIVTEKQERIDEWINICVRGRNYEVKAWEEECKDPFNDLEIQNIASQQCSIKVYKPKLKLNISKEDDGLANDKNVESQGFDESNAEACNHHTDACSNVAIDATLVKDQHLILPKPGTSLDMEVVNSFSEANSYSSCGLDSIVDDSVEKEINVNDGNTLEEDVLNHNDKEMAAAKSKGKEKVIATNKRKHNACPVVGYLREKNVGVVIREERANVICLDKDTEMAEATSKGKEKAISTSKGKENAFPVDLQRNG